MVPKSNVDLIIISNISGLNTHPQAVPKIGTRKGFTIPSLPLSLIALPPTWWKRNNLSLHLNSIGLKCFSVLSWKSQFMNDDHYVRAMITRLTMQLNLKTTSSIKWQTIDALIWITKQMTEKTKTWKIEMTFWLPFRVF